MKRTAPETQNVTENTKHTRCPDCKASINDEHTAGAYDEYQLDLENQFTVMLHRLTTCTHSLKAIDWY